MAQKLEKSGFSMKGLLGKKMQEEQNKEKLQGDSYQESVTPVESAVVSSKVSQRVPIRKGVKGIKKVIRISASLSIENDNFLKNCHWTEHKSYSAILEEAVTMYKENYIKTKGVPPSPDPYCL